MKKRTAALVRCFGDVYEQQMGADIQRTCPDRGGCGAGDGLVVSFAVVSASSQLFFSVLSGV